MKQFSEKKNNKNWFEFPLPVYTAKLVVRENKKPKGQKQGNSTFNTRLL